MEELAHAAMNGGRGLSVELLIEDRFKQGLKRGWGRVKTQLEVAHSFDQLAQLRVARFQMRKCFGRIEGEFSLFSIVDHRRTVYRPSMGAQCEIKLDWERCSLWFALKRDS